MLRVAIKVKPGFNFKAVSSHRPDKMENEEGNKRGKWKLYVDSSTNENGSRAGIMLISLEGHKITLVVRFKFKASNNEALIAGLWLANHLKVENIIVHIDSQLVINQVKEEYQV